jgi:hypothetical protein
VNTIHNEKGFVLVTSLLILVILTMLGIAATRNTSIELQIAGNDRVHKVTFYSAEADDILGTEVLEQNFSCPTGFKPTGGVFPNDYADIEGEIRVYNRRKDRTDASYTAGKMNNLTIWSNLEFVPENLDPSDPAFYITNINEADVAFPISSFGGTGTSYLYIAGQIQMLPGGALQMAAGYEGKGKGAGSGGVGKIMDIYSGAHGERSSLSHVLFGWRHLVGNEGDCKYD